MPSDPSTGPIASRFGSKEKLRKCAAPTPTPSASGDRRTADTRRRDGVLTKAWTSEVRLSSLKRRSAAERAAQMRESEAVPGSGGRLLRVSDRPDFERTGCYGLVLVIS